MGQSKNEAGDASDVNMDSVLRRMALMLNNGADWDSERRSQEEKSRKLAWRVASGMTVVAMVAIVSAASVFPLKTTVPYLVHSQTSETGVSNVEVLHAFDSRTIEHSELLNKYWARAYVTAREQYNWWLVGGDYDFVNRLTDESIVPEYNNQFKGPQALDKVFKDLTERRIKILSVTPSPTMANQMVVRFERSTTQKGALVEQPTVFVVNMSYRYDPQRYGGEMDLIRNPMGFKVFAYRRDVEAAPAPAEKTAAATGGNQ